MHILLTGASGFLGSVCAKLLTQRSYPSFSVLRSGSSSRSVPLSGRSFSAPSTHSASELIATLNGQGISHIVHLAALSSPETCEREPLRAHSAHISFTRMLSTCAATIGAHLTTVSTDLVFDGCRAPPGGLSESDPPCPISVYAQTKREAEEETLRASTHAVVRLALIYGRSSGESQGVLGWMTQAFAENKPIPLFDDEFRTPIHVRDAANAILQIAERNLSGLWHCGGPDRISRVQFGIHIARAFGWKEGLIEPTSRLTYTAHPARPEDVSLRSEKLWKELGCAPAPIEEAVRRYDTE